MHLVIGMHDFEFDPKISVPLLLPPSFLVFRYATIDRLEFNFKSNSLKMLSSKNLSILARSNRWTKYRLGSNFTIKRLSSDKFSFNSTFQFWGRRIFAFLRSPWYWSISFELLVARSIIRLDLYVYRTEEKREKMLTNLWILRYKL